MSNPFSYTTRIATHDNNIPSASNQFESTIMLSLTTLATLVASAVLANAESLEKRAPSQWQLHPFGDTYDRVSAVFRYPLVSTSTDLQFDQCLGVFAGYLQNGASLSVSACSQTDTLSVFEFEREQPGVVRLAGTDFCLDAGLGKL
jgi:hypothetical protein